MKKTILFITTTLDSGGVSKSLLSLLNTIDKERYDISLYLLSGRGVFKSLIPQQVKVIEDRRTTMLFDPFPSNIFNLLKSGYLLVALLRFIAILFSPISKSVSGYLISISIRGLKQTFDLVVDYNGQHQLYFIADKIDAKKRVSFFHSDYAKYPYYYVADKHYYNKVDKIFTISPFCVESMKRYFPQQESKIELMENISSIELIMKFSEETTLNIENDNVINIVTIGHVIKPKGADLAIKSAEILKSKGVDFKWYFIGRNDEMGDLSDLIEECGISDNLILLGVVTNPYPYIKQADIIVHPSRFEGKSIALDEAKILLKPIVVTNFTTVKDQFEDRYNASICEMNEASISSAIIELIENPKLRKHYTENLLQDRSDNASEVEKIYNLLEQEWKNFCGGTNT